MSLSLYLHIPFCASKCAYCAFYSYITDASEREAYVEALINQIKNAGKAHPGVHIESVFFGGGTPSLLTAREMFKIADALSLSFDLSDAEITSEANPDSVDNLLDPSLTGFFTRISMGVQSFDDIELRLLGRRHSAKQAVSAFERVRIAGIDNINIDIMLALPSENHTESLKNTVSTALLLAPEHISAYILTPEENTPLYNVCKTVNEDSTGSAYLYTCAALEAAGYEHYEISNFTRPGKRCRHNMSYWTQQRYLAFGSQASGFDGKIRYVNDCTATEYIKQNGLILPKTEEVLDADALEQENLMLSLRLSDGTDKKTLGALNTVAPKRLFIERLLSENLAFINQRGGLSLTDSGFLVSNGIIAELI